MNAALGFERCLAYLQHQLRPAPPPRLYSRNTVAWRAVTISRQAGAGAHVVAEHLAQLLMAGSAKDAAPWTIFDRNLIEKVLEDHHLPQRLARFMPEDRVPAIQDALDELFGLHPPTRTLVHKTAETVLHLAELGNVILIGRGGNIITSKLDSVFHVRLVASLDHRLEYIGRCRQLDGKSALRQILMEDHGRRRYGAHLDTTTI